ncbi:MAG: peptide MFS transporter [Massilibacteroides sp.]|nr:peptide MFS transporter [Massilibacteroides sp.]MDD3064089.1 peptide MFS transporter [Massilibacteroides sp.]MDD4115237.1 peptide MFS transporter [Massilibacteroides sp.]MDD4661386.1 peptide MFS transporter [Massilibacteroides sp.]
MFKNHPKGLIAASLANMGERFGFYTMMAILSLFLMSKFGLDKTNSGIIYSVFYFSIYILALVGGIIADKTRNFKRTIMAGIILMAFGYLILAIPTDTPVLNVPLFLTLTCVGLFTIAFGNGLFKGNLQALVGQMYDNKQYASMRDSGFSLFYMFINVGAIFAPMTAVAVRNGWLEKNGFLYNSDISTLCHQYLSGTLSSEAAVRYNELMTQVTLGPSITDPGVFANTYLNVFNTGFHYAFGVAILALIISLLIFVLNKKKFPEPTVKNASTSTEEVPAIDAKEVKQRLYALFAVFAVVIFFWFSFHQNGLTLTFFANDYTLLKLGNWNLTAEIFQTANPFFVVFLTPIILAFFGWLRAKGKEPSAPRKIAIGMGIAAVAYIVMTIGSMALPASAEVNAMGGLPDAQRVTPFLLIGTYLILTIAELFISPLGISFVSKVAPPQYQGIMQGCWLGATALGNQLLFVGAILYEQIPIWQTWSVFVIACLISMFAMLFMLNWLERITK